MSNQPYIRMIEFGRFRVRSFTTDAIYQVNLGDSIATCTCTCPDYARHGGPCKHIIAVIISVAASAPMSALAITGAAYHRGITDIIMRDDVGNTISALHPIVQPAKFYVTAPAPEREAVIAALAPRYRTLLARVPGVVLPPEPTPEERHQRNRRLLGRYSDEEIARMLV